MAWRSLVSMEYRMEDGVGNRWEKASDILCGKE